MSIMTVDPDQTAGSNDVTIVLSGDRILARCPYNLKFILGAKRLAGKWLSEDKVWTFSTQHEDLVRGLCNQWFGTDGTSPPDLVDVQITFLQRRSEHEGPVTAFGRVVARARGRGGGALASGAGPGRPTPIATAPAVKSACAA